MNDLKHLLRQQKSALSKERIQLYLLKTQQAKTVQDAARLLSRHSVRLGRRLTYHN